MFVGENINLFSVHRVLKYRCDELHERIVSSDISRPNTTTRPAYCP